MRPKLLSITPMIPTGGSLDEALQFYTKQLGFSVTWQSGTMAGIKRDLAEFHLVQNSSREWAENASFSIATDDLDALYAEYRDITAGLGPLEMKAWGRREFHMIVPSGVCLQFYSAKQ